MHYGFDLEHAKKYGINEAIMINNFQYWIIKNRANKTNFYQNHYWTYNTIPALARLFPFWTPRQVRYTLDSLFNKGVLIRGNFNKTKYDKTTWYAFADESAFLPPEEENSGNSDVSKLSDEKNNFVTPIPDNIPDIKQEKENKNNKLFLQKKVYGEFENVMLTEDELKKLIKSYGWYLTDAIEKLSSYLAYKGDKYKSHYAVFAKNNWVWKEVHNDPECGSKPKLDYVMDDTVPGGMRLQTPTEYYFKKYNLSE